MTTFDWVCLGLAIMGISLVIYLLYLNDWDIEKVMFKD